MKKKFVKIVSGVLSTTILLESCSSGFYIDAPADEINQAITKNNIKNNSIAIPLKIQLSNSDIEYLEFLQKLAIDISKDSSVAHNFITDPAKYIKDNGFDISFASLDAKLTQMILAMADQDICNAIKEHDITKYLSLMKEKGLIKDISIKNLDDLGQINDQINTSDGLLTNNEAEITASLFFPFVAVGVAVAIWAVAVEHFFVGNAVAVGTAIVYAAAISTKTSGESNRTYETLSSTNAIEVYSIKSEDLVDKRVIADAYIEQSVATTIKYLKEQYPEEMENHNETVLKNAIILNLQKLAYENK